MCVCVCLGSAKRRREERREKVDEIGAWKYESMHGSPLDKNELAHTKSTLSFFVGLGRKWRGKEKIFGL